MKEDEILRNVEKKVTISSTMMRYKIICIVVFDQNVYKAEAEITYLQPTDSEWLKAGVNCINNKQYTK